MATLLPVKKKPNYKKIRGRIRKDYTDLIRITRIVHVIRENAALYLDIAYIWKHMSSPLTIVYTMIRAIEQGDNKIFDPHSIDSMNELERLLYKQVDYNILDDNYTPRITNKDIISMKQSTQKMTERKFTDTPVEQLVLSVVTLIEKEDGGKRFDFNDAGSKNRLIEGLTNSCESVGKVRSIDRSAENAELSSSVMKKLTLMEADLLIGKLK